MSVTVDTRKSSANPRGWYHPHRALSLLLAMTLLAAVGWTAPGLVAPRNLPAAQAAPQTITMGDFTASMTQTGGTLPGDASITCIRTATVEAGGTTTAGGQMVGTGGTSYLAHGDPYFGSCPPGTEPADIQSQSAIGFAPKAPASAPAGTPFLLGQVSHQNWVINADRQDGTSGATRLYGDLNVNFSGATGGTSDSFSWNLTETPNSETVEKDAAGNPLYLWIEYTNGRYVYSYKTTPQNAGDEPAQAIKRNQAGQPLYEQWAYDYYYGWYVTGEATTPDPRSSSDPGFYSPVITSSGYVDDVTQFSDVRSTKVFTTAGGMPYRLVIRGFTPSDGTCPATPPANSMTQQFITHENEVTYGCLYASWEQERPVVVEKEAKNLSTSTPTIPSFQYGVKQWDPATNTFITPTSTWTTQSGWTDFSLQPTAFGEAGVVRTTEQLLVPIDGVQVTETKPTPALTATTAGWELTSVQCVQGPATESPAGSGTYVPDPVDWTRAGTATYPEVVNRDGSPIRVDAATGQADLANVEMADNPSLLGITCRYVNTYDDKPTPSVKKTVTQGQQTPIVPAADGTFTVSYDITVTNSSSTLPVDHPAITDDPGFAPGLAVTSVTVDGQAVTLNADGTFQVAPAGTLAKGETKTFTVVITGKSTLTSTTAPAAGQCQTTGDGTAGQGTFNQVVMAGDPDTTDNDACVPVVPETRFRVEKASDETGLEITQPGTSEITRNYTVTVTNDGAVDGTSKAVTDTPSMPAGFTIKSITVDGVLLPSTTIPFQVTAGDQLAAGASKAHKVAIVYTVDSKAVTGSANLGQCDASDATPDKTKGLYNLVTMEGDSDGVENNDACTPVTMKPTFKVAKTTSTSPIVLDKGDTSAQVTYTVSVTNNGPGAGVFPDVVETPAAPAGFTIASVTVDGTAVSSPYTIKGTSLAEGQTKNHTVVVTYTVDQAKVTDWTSLGECATDGASTDPAKGLYNLVTMDGDSDGADNNDACVPVTAKGSFSVAKSTNQSPIVLKPGDTTAERTYTVTVTNNGAAPGTSPQVMDVPSAPAGFTITKVTVDGVEKTAPYEVTPGDQLDAGASKEHTVVVTYAVDTTAIDAAGWTSLGSCDAADATPDATKGLYNLVTMAGDSDGVANNDACTPVTGTPGVQIIKKINGDDANTAPGVVVPIGSTMKITFEVTNTGNQPLGKVTVTDDKVAASSIVCAPATNNVIPTLAVGQTVTCTADLAAPAPGTQHSNVGTASGTPPTRPDGSTPPPVEDDDPAHAVPPTFAVAKSTTQGPVTLAIGQTEVTRTYTVNVTNKGTVEATSAKVTDTPRVPAGFTIKSVTVDGVVVAGPAPYQVTAGDTLAGGATRAHTVVVVYTVDQAAVPANGWTDLALCQTDGASTDPTKGLYNVVAMPGDSDGVENNDACTPVNPPKAFSVEKSTADGPVVLAKDQNSVKRTYTVTVTNVGPAAERSAEVLDTPSMPAGFTIATVSVDGVEVAANAEGKYLVTAGDQLNAGEARQHTVVVTYTVDQAKVTDWTSLGQCATDGASTDPAKGLYNLVTMDGDSDGVDNNDVCTPVTAKGDFAVRKSNVEPPVVLADGQTEVTRTYTVSVTNTGNDQGTSPQVTDTPALPAGFTIKSVTVDGTEVTGDPYLVTRGDTLAKGGTKDHTVVVVYTVDQAKVTDWTSLGECATDGASTDPAKGLYNLVTMDGDSDGVDNNDVCTPVTGSPRFRVAKTTTDSQVVLTKDQKSVSVTYTVTITNDGLVAGATKPVVDTPSTPTGFTIATVTIDGKAATAPYTIPGGAQLQPGGVSAHTVVVTYTVDQAKVTDWTSLGECATDGASTDPAKGLYNLVTMDGDSDGADNNDACVPVTPTGDFAVAKSTADGPVRIPEGTSELTRTYTVTVTNTGSAQLTSPKVTDAPSVPAGFTIASVTIDGKVVDGPAPYVVTSGDSLAGGASAAHTVVVVYTIDAAAVTDWTALGQCATEGASTDPAKGVYNVVAMDGDSDGVENNDVCTPVTGTPKFAVAKSTADMGVVLTKDQKSVTRTYTVTVTNTGLVQGTTKAVIDQPSTPSGFSIETVTIDGKAAAAPYTIPGGDVLNPGQAKEHTVVVTYTVDQAKVTDWTSMGECATDGASTDPAKGLYNLVTMDGDSDGVDNNDVCTPVTPTGDFAVAKTTSQAPLVLADGQTEVSREYTVTVTNTGSAQLTSPKVTDAPSVPAGFTIASVTIDGKVVDGPAPYLVTAGDKLAGGARAEHQVVVVYTVDQAKVTDWTSLGECATDGASTDPGKGLYNVVDMAGDSDGVDNNDACTPVSGTPRFAVDKSTSDPAVVLPKDATQVKRSYTVTVTNTGLVSGTSARVTDTPQVPEGFSIASVTIDGKPATAPYLVTNGDNLAKGASKAHTVVVTYRVDQAKVTDWTSLGECATDGASTDPGKGLYNLVTMAGDSDGADNNDVCTPVTPVGDFAVAKTTPTKPIVLAPGQTSVEASYTVTVTNTGRKSGTSPEVTDTPALPAGFSIASVTVDGNRVAGPAYRVTAGDELAAGASKAHIVVVTYTVTPASVGDWARLGRCDAADDTPDRTAGLYNLVDMAGDSDGTANNDACVPVTGTPGVTVVKKINGDDANSAPGVLVSAGSTMRITFEITNTGNVPLTSVKVTDDKVAAKDISCPKATLAVGEEMTCTATLKAPRAGGRHVDVGTVVGTPPAGADGSRPRPVTDDDPAYAHVPDVPASTPTPIPHKPIPNTGSDVNPALLAGGALAALAGVGVLLVGRRRKDEE